MHIAKIGLLWTFSILLNPFSYSQELQVDSLGYETFEMADGDTSYLMKKYYLVFLNKGENRNHNESEGAEIQKGHMAHMDQMASDGYVCIAGPMGDNGDLRGILIMSVPSMEFAQNLLAEDPAIKAGRLSYEIKPWWASVGSTLD